MQWKLARDLRPGDIIQLTEPPTRARITHNVEIPTIKMRCDRLGPIQEPQTARDIRLVMIDGSHAGRRDYVFAHPEDKVRVVK